jgi:hypothetical protein
VEHFLGKEEVTGSIPVVGFGFRLGWIALQITDRHLLKSCKSHPGRIS